MYLICLFLNVRIENQHLLILFLTNLIDINNQNNYDININNINLYFFYNKVNIIQSFKETAISHVIKKKDLS